MRILENHHRISQIELASRSVGMSYGRYVALTGGAVPPPEELVLAADPKTVTCEFCGKRFRPSMERNIYCSDTCRKASYDKREAAIIQAKQKVCPVCGKLFPPHGTQKYYSPEHRKQAAALHSRSETARNAAK